MNLQDTKSLLLADLDDLKRMAGSRSDLFLLRPFSISPMPSPSPLIAFEEDIAAEFRLSASRTAKKLLKNVNRQGLTP